MSIWFKKYTIQDLEKYDSKSIHPILGIQFTEIGKNSISASMPIDHRTMQPAGILHGGASVVLAESLGSVGSNLIIDPANFYCVGQSINANHIRPGISGKVLGTAKPIHLGKTSHIWNIELKNEANKLVCVCRLTMAVIPKK